MRFFTRLVLLLVLGYAAVCAAMYLRQDSLIFITRPLPADHPRLKLHPEWQHRLEHDGEVLHGWLLNPESEHLVVYYGGNAEDVSRLVEKFADAGHATLLFAYRGYGRSTGEPTATALRSDAAWLLEQAPRLMGHTPRRTTLWGRSLGAGVAMQVAAGHPVDDLILVTPFDSLAAVAEDQYPWLPVDALLHHRFDSAAVADRVKAPVLIITVPGDRIVPEERGTALADALRAAGNQQVQVVRLENTTHVRVPDHHLFAPTIAAFLRQPAGGDQP